MISTYLRAVAATALLLAATDAQALVVLTGATYAENFNTLAATGTSNATAGGVLANGWQILEGGTNANTTYAAGNGSANAGNTYSFGAVNSPDRALGTLRSGSLDPRIGAIFRNDTGASILSVALGYTGEQWRFGGTQNGRGNSLDVLNFQYSLNATSLTSGTWTDLDALDFASLVTSGSTGGNALDGNSVDTALSGVLDFGSGIAAGSTFAIRWLDADPTGADDGLAIDDFNLTATLAGVPGAVPEPASWATMIAGFGLIGGSLRTRRRTLVAA